MKKIPSPIDLTVSRPMPDTCDDARRRTKFWSSFPFTWHGDHRPTTSPSTPSSWMSFSSDNSSCGATSDRVGSLEERPSQFKRYWQWPGKRLSRFISPSKTSFRSSSPTSPCIPPTTSQKAVSPTILFDNPTPLSPNSCHRSTLNLQPPDLSREDLGKVNARYAPLPSTLRAVSSKSVPEPAPPPSISTSSLSVAVPTHSQQQYLHPRLVHRRGIPIALPLSPVESLVDGGGGGEFFSTSEEGGVIYLTVEDDGLDEESGEASLCLVEIPE